MSTTQVQKVHYLWEHAARGAVQPDSESIGHLDIDVVTQTPGELGDTGLRGSFVTALSSYRPFAAMTMTITGASTAAQQLTEIKQRPCCIVDAGGLILCLLIGYA